ncbi:MAG: AAA family ATPase [Candidatus Sericytochromatia bacterium]
MYGWILQINPQERDLVSTLRQLKAGQIDPEQEWSVQRYARRLQAGQRVLFWQSGPQGGALAWGELLSAAYRAPDGQGDWWVGCRVTHTLEPPLTRQALQQVPELADLPLLRRPQGRWLPIEPTHMHVLEALLASRLQVLEPPVSAHPLSGVLRRLQREGLLIEGDWLRRYHLALQVSPLVILAGPSGLGKSWLAQAYAKVSGAEHLLVPVAPNWVSPEDLFGYYNAVTDRFQPSPVTVFLKAAAADKSERAWHLILDEFNLARPEHYLAPLLSVLEQRRRGETVGLSLADGSWLKVSPHLRVIGTLNREGSVYALSERVHDRAQFLELTLNENLALSRWGQTAWWPLLAPWWPALQNVVPFGYRVLDDMQAYVQAALELGVPAEQAVDEQVAHKILARLSPLHAPEAMERLLADLPTSWELSRGLLQRVLHQAKEAGGADWLA